jgi:ribosomal protein RSM22 (predicted rRNA methylase)
MPSNLYRVASVWAELHRLGYQWSQPSNGKTSSLQAIEFGAGPASGACGIAAGETYAPLGLPEQGTWALIEQDRAILELGAQWAGTYFASMNKSNWSLRTFHRKIDLSLGFLPTTAPRFNLWLMSFYLNELQESPALLAKQLLKAWEQHLEDESLIILIEPALKEQSRKLLELRKALLQEEAHMENLGLKVLLPCLGHQTCHALINPNDWCHEDVSWWRPPYFKTIDRLAGLDRKSLPFSYLVIAKSKKSRAELLPTLAQQDTSNLYRLVSPSHSEGQDLEFFICGQDGKRRARYRPKANTEEENLDRGDILINTQIRGDTQASRIESCEIL